MRHGLVVEDLPDTRVWLTDVLREGFPDINVVTASTIQEAFQQLEVRCPDIALVDLGLPDGNGLDIIQHLNRTCIRTHCIVTTIFDDDHHIFPALRAGANGYILKEQSKAEMLPLLQGIVEHKPPLSPAIARKLLDFFHPSMEKTPSNLTRREEEVLVLIAKGYSSAKVAELLGLKRNTVSSYVKEIYRKLNISSRAEATLEASRRGMINPHAP